MWKLRAGVTVLLGLLPFAPQAETLQVQLQGSVSQLQTWILPTSCVGRNCPVQDAAHMGDVAAFRGYTLGGDATVTLTVDVQSLQVVSTTLAGGGLPTGMWNPWAGGSATGPQARLKGDTLSIDGWLVSGSSADYRFVHDITLSAGALAGADWAARLTSADVVALAPSVMRGCGDAPTGGCLDAQITWRQAVISSVPEPGSLATFAFGLAGLAAGVTRRRRQVLNRAA